MIFTLGQFYRRYFNPPSLKSVWKLHIKHIIEIPKGPMSWSRCYKESFLFHNNHVMYNTYWVSLLIFPHIYFVLHSCSSITKLTFHCTLCILASTNLYTYHFLPQVIHSTVIDSIRHASFIQQNDMLLTWWDLINIFLLQWTLQLFIFGFFRVILASISITKNNVWFVCCVSCLMVTQGNQCPYAFG